MEMDEILHGKENLNLSRMQEGDLEILRDEIQKMIATLVDNVKQIKLQYMISLDKKDRNLN